jgi:hypothetical protein
MANEGNGERGVGSDAVPQLVEAFMIIGRVNEAHVTASAELRGFGFGYSFAYLKLLNLF